MSNGTFDDKDDPVTVPDGTNIPFDHVLEQELELDDTTPACGPTCRRCGRAMVRILNSAPQPTKEQAKAFDVCTGTQLDPEEGGWRVCADQKFLKGLLDEYFGPDRRVARLPPPSGVDRRQVHEPPRPRSPSQDVGE